MNTGVSKVFTFEIVIHLNERRGRRRVLLVQHHMRMVTQMEGFRTLCSLLPASSSCRSLAFNSSLVLCLICSWRSADNCSFSSFIAEILDFSSRTTRSVSYGNPARTNKGLVVQIQQYISHCVSV